MENQSETKPCINIGSPLRLAPLKLRVDSTGIASPEREFCKQPVYIPVGASQQEIRIQNYLSMHNVYRVDIKETLDEMNSAGTRVQSPTLRAEITKRQMKNNQSSFLAKRMSVMQKSNTLSINPASPN